MNRIFILAAVFVLATSVALSAEESKHSYMPVAGYIPDAEIAIRVAVAIWDPIYGRKQIEAQKPYRAVLNNGVWTVEGSLPKGMLGGVAVAEIQKSDGKIIRISHGK